MDLNDVQRAGIKLALETLSRDPDHTHDMALIRRLVGAEGAKQVHKLRAEYTADNKAASENGGAFLSADAADYWQEAQSALAYGAMVYANPSNGGYGKRERALSRKCEDLLASFDRRVPKREQAKFRQYIDGDKDNWDDRWHNTRDGFFPLLETHFVASRPIRNPMGEAQRDVLGSYLDTTPTPEERDRNVQRISSILDRFREERSAQELKLIKAAKSVGAS